MDLLHAPEATQPEKSGQVESRTFDPPCYKPDTTAAELTSLRSLLFVPGADERKLTRALASPADAVIADLEDSVPADVKPLARRVTRDALSAERPRPACMVRVNAADTADFAEDLALIEELRPAAVVLPKAAPESVRALALVGVPVLAIVETAMGIRMAFETASEPHVFALMVGAVDLSAELGLEPRADGLELLHVRSKLVVDSAAAGTRPPFDAVHVKLDDPDGLEVQARVARSLGLRGKACIHPAQVEIVNEVFTPDAAAVEWARSVIEAAETAAAQGTGAVAVGGTMVDAPVVARAHRIIGESERSRAQ